MSRRKVSVPDFSAIHCCPPCSEPHDEKLTLTKWTVETGHSSIHDQTQLLDPETGAYVVPTDGLYTIVVQLIKLNGANTPVTARRRRAAHYALEISKPPRHTTADDAVVSDYHDIGSRNFAQLIHLAADSRVSCLRMPGTATKECIRLKVELVQRKRKRPNDDDLDSDDTQRTDYSRSRKKRARTTGAQSPTSHPASDTDSEDSDEESDEES